MRRALATGARLLVLVLLMSGLAPMAFAATAYPTLTGGTAGPGDSCSPASALQINGGTTLICNGTIWVFATQIFNGGAFKLSTATDTCAAGLAGAIRYSGGAVQFCNGTIWANIDGSGGTALSALTAATATNNINNAAYEQIWNWNSLAGANGLTLATTSTAATGNTQTLLNVQMSGANATSTQTTYGEWISNTHTGTASTNVGLYATASGGTNNYAAIFNGGNLGIGTTAPDSSSKLDVVGGPIWTEGGGLTSGTFYSDLKLGQSISGHNPLLDIQTMDDGSASSTKFFANRWQGFFSFTRASPTTEKKIAEIFGKSGGATTLTLYDDDVSTQNVVLSTSGNSWFNGGNVGIGTTGPVNKLTATGDGTGIAQLGTGGCGSNYVGLTLGLTSAPSGCSNFNILSSPTDQTLYMNRPTGNAIRFRENNSDQMVIVPGGAVGIGGDPIAGVKLEVFGDGYSTGGERYNNVAIGPYSPWGMAANEIAAYGTALVLQNAGGGNVGIGTPSPQVKLDIAGSGAAAAIGTEDEFHLTRPINSGNSYPQLATFQLGTYTANSSGNGYGPSTRLDINLKAAANSTLTGDTNVMTLLSSGNVGIGATAPGELLEVKSPFNGSAGSAPDQVVMRVWNPYHTGSTGEAARLEFVLDQDNTTYKRAEISALSDTSNFGNEANLIFKTGSAALSSYGERMRIASGGNVGIGTTTPNATLDVNGYSKLAKNASAPVTCDATHEGSIAYTGTTTHYLCFCDGTSWKPAHSPSTACSW